MQLNQKQNCEINYNDITFVNINNNEVYNNDDIQSINDSLFKNTLIHFNKKTKSNCTVSTTLMKSRLKNQEIWIYILKKKANIISYGSNISSYLNQKFISFVPDTFDERSINITELCSPMCNKPRIHPSNASGFDLFEETMHGRVRLMSLISRNESLINENQCDLDDCEEDTSVNVIISLYVRKNDLKKNVLILFLILLIT